MKKIIGIILGVGILGLVIFRLSSLKKSSQSEVYQYRKENPVMVGVDTLQLRPIEPMHAYTGTFEPARETKLSADVQGKINNMWVDVGSRVAKGQTLVQLDQALLKLQLQSVDVQIDGLEADVERFKILAEADAIQGIQLEKAEQGLKAAKIQRATLQEQIYKTEVKAPFDGVITAKLNEAGGFAAPGIPLLQITDIATLRFTIHVTESELAQFQMGQLHEVSADAYPDMQLTAKVIMTGSKANMGNRFPVQLELANTKDYTIKSGMFGKVHISTPEHEQGLLIPSSAIVEHKGSSHVYLIRNGKAQLHPVKLSNNIGNKVVISGGLAPQDVIVSSGFINLFDGANITTK